MSHNSKNVVGGNEKKLQRLFSRFLFFSHLQMFSFVRLLLQLFVFLYVLFRVVWWIYFQPCQPKNSFVFAAKQTHRVQCPKLMSKWKKRIVFHKRFVTDVTKFLREWDSDSMQSVEMGTQSATWAAERNLIPSGWVKERNSLHNTTRSGWRSKENSFTLKGSRKHCML